MNHQEILEHRCTELQAALEDVLNHYVLSDAPEEAVIDRAGELLDRLHDEHPSE